MQEVYELPIPEMIVYKSHRALCIADISDISRERIREEVLKHHADIYMVGENEDKNVIFVDMWKLKK